MELETGIDAVMIPSAESPRIIVQWKAEPGVEAVA